ncbi:hypothetical protein ABK040_000964 [Willaertia magna]
MGNSVPNSLSNLPNNHSANTYHTAEEDNIYEDYDLIIDIDSISPTHLQQKGWEIHLSKEIECRIMDRIKTNFTQIAFQQQQLQQQQYMNSTLPPNLNTNTPTASPLTNNLNTNINYTTNIPPPTLQNSNFGAESTSEMIPNNQNSLQKHNSLSFINSQAIIPGVLPTQILMAPSRPPSPSSNTNSAIENTGSSAYSDDTLTSAGDITPRSSFGNEYDHNNNTMNGNNNSYEYNNNNNNSKLLSHKKHHHYINYFAEIEHKFTQTPMCVVSVIGNQQVGKTHILNELSKSNLKVGISTNQQQNPFCFKVPRNNQGRDWLFIDTMGMKGPLKISEIKKYWKEIMKSNNVNNNSGNNNVNEKNNLPSTSTSGVNSVINNESQMSSSPTGKMVPPLSLFNQEETLQSEQWNLAIQKAVEERKKLESFTQEILLNMSHFILIVVNQMNWEEQQLLYELLYKRDSSINPTTGKSRKTTFIVIHNFKDCETMDNFNKLVQRYVVEAFPGELRSKEVTLIGNNTTSIGFAPFFTSGSGNHVINHVFLAKKDSEVGKKFNELTFSLIRIWLASQSTERIHCMTSYITSHVQAAIQKYITHLKDVQMNFKLKKNLLDENELYMSPRNVSNQNSNNNSLNSNSSTVGMLSAWVSSKVSTTTTTATATTTATNTTTNKKTKSSSSGSGSNLSVGQFELKFIPEDDLQLEFIDNVELQMNNMIVGMYSGGIVTKEQQKKEKL